MLPVWRMSARRRSLSLVPERILGERSEAPAPRRSGDWDNGNAGDGDGARTVRYLVKWRGHECALSTFLTRSELLATDSVHAKEAMRQYDMRKATWVSPPRYAMRRFMSQAMYEDTQWIFNACCFVHHGNCVVSGCAGPSLQLLALFVLVKQWCATPSLFSVEGGTKDGVRAKEGVGSRGTPPPARVQAGTYPSGHSEPIVVLTEEQRVPPWAELIRMHSNLHAVPYAGSSSSRSVVRAYELCDARRYDVLVLSKEALIEDSTFLTNLNFQMLIVDAIPDIYKNQAFCDVFAALRARRKVFLFPQAINGFPNQLAMLLGFVDPQGLASMRKAHERAGRVPGQPVLLRRLGLFTRHVTGEAEGRAQPPPRGSHPLAALYADLARFHVPQSDGTSEFRAPKLRAPEPRIQRDAKTFSPVRPAPRAAPRADVEARVREGTSTETRKRRERLHAVYLEKMTKARRVDGDNAAVIGLVGLMAKAILQWSG